MPRILVIDDDPSLRGLLRAALTREGYSIVEAGDGAEGLARYKQGAVDLVITDILMPEREGLETIRELKRLDQDVKILAMSGGGRQLHLDVLHIAQRFGAAAIIEKPFDLSQFVSLVKETLAS